MVRRKSIIAGILCSMLVLGGCGKAPEEISDYGNGTDDHVVENSIGGIDSLSANAFDEIEDIYTEVLQNAIVDMMLEGRVKDASTCSLTVDNECLKRVYDNIDLFSKRLTIRQSEISNSPEVIRRLGVIAINTAIEVDIYGNANSTHISGTKMMNGIGGSGDFERNAYISIFTCSSVAKGGLISAIVPFVSHQDHSEHDVNVIITEQGIADLRGKAPIERAQLIIENCAHPDYRPLLREYVKIASGGQTHHNLPAAFAMHDTLRRKGDMRLTDFSEYIKD